MSSEGNPPVRNCINLPRKAVLPFSDAVLVGNILYLSGRIGIIRPRVLLPPASRMRCDFSSMSLMRCCAGRHDDG